MKWKLPLSLPHYWVLTGLLCMDWPPVRRMSSVFKPSTSWVSAMNPRNQPLFLWEPLLVSLPFTIQSALIFHQETIYFGPFPLAKHIQKLFFSRRCLLLINPWCTNDKKKSTHQRWPTRLLLHDFITVWKMSLFIFIHRSAQESCYKITTEKMFSRRQRFL